MKPRSRSWERKIHPAFKEIARFRGVVANAELARGTDRTEVLQNLRRLSAELRHRLLAAFPDLVPPVAGAPIRTKGYLRQAPEEQGAANAEYHFYRRFGIPLGMALAKEASGDLDAHNQLLRARDEAWKINHDYRVLPYKRDQIHADLIELGLGLGLNTMTAEEVADCFNCLCPCGREHDADAMKKQRRRVKKQLEEAQRLSWQLTPSRERFAVYGRSGYIAKPYRPQFGSPYVEISRRGRGLEYVVWSEEIRGYSQDAEFDFPAVFVGLPFQFELTTVQQIFEMFFPLENR